jgi:hypothetical protein
MTDVHLLVPALWGTDEFDLPLRMPALCRCLGQGRRIRPSTGCDATGALFALFGVNLPAGAGMPVAAASHWADFPDVAPSQHAGEWLRVDPVHLRPDLGKLLLFDAEHLQITAEEASRLLVMLNEHLSDEGLTIDCGASPNRWYIHLPRHASLVTVAPSSINGRHVDPYIARGEDARLWQRRVLELQMLLHRSDVNAEREQRGQPAINSLWPWGGGELPRLASPACSAVASDDVVAAGLARAAGIPIIDAGDVNAITAQSGAVLVVPTIGMGALGQGDAGAWAEALSALDDALVRPLRGALWRGRVQTLHLHVPAGHWALQRHDLWRFWRSMEVQRPPRNAAGHG